MGIVDVIWIYLAFFISSVRVQQTRSHNWITFHILDSTFGWFPYHGNLYDYRIRHHYFRNDSFTQEFFSRSCEMSYRLPTSFFGNVCNSLYLYRIVSTLKICSKDFHTRLHFDIYDIKTDSTEIIEAWNIKMIHEINW